MFTLTESVSSWLLTMAKICYGLILYFRFGEMFFHKKGV